MDRLSNIIARIKSYEPLWDGWVFTGELLGSGRMSCVLALSRGDERSVVKVIFVENESVQYQMVKNEINTMLSFHGNYLVECLHNREEPVLNRQGDCIGYDFLIHMNEYLPLSQFLKEEEYDPVELCRQLVSDVGMALGSLHAKGILHRDIKPENIFLDTSTDKTHYRLGDFGVSKKLEGLSGLTATGTPDFMAPESFRYYEYSYCSDIYSLGMTLYYILNDLHFPQFSDGQSQQNLWENNRRRLSGEKLPPPEFGDQDLQSAVLKCCEAEPKQRYQDVSELLNELLGQHFVPFGMKRKEERLELRKKEIKHKRFRLAFIVFAVLVIAIVTVGIITVLNQQSAKGKATADSVFSQYDPDELKASVYNYNRVGEEFRQKEKTLNSFGDSYEEYKYSFDDLYGYIKQSYNEKPENYNDEPENEYIEYCFDNSGNLFYICWTKTNSTVQLYVLRDEIFYMTITGDPNRYTYGDPEITDEMKSKVAKGYILYSKFIERAQ